VNKGGIAALAVALTIAAVVAGCGSGGGTASLSKAEYIKQASAVCDKATKQAQTEFANFVSELAKEPKTQQANEAAQTEVANTILIPGKEQELEGLKKLDAPKGDEERVEEITGALEDGIEATRKDSGHAVTNSGKTFAKAQVLAAKYGLKNC